MSVYKNDRLEYFQSALESIIYQTIKPDEIILTVDGPISESLDALIYKYEQEISILKTIRLSKNKGLGIAHQIGVNNCSYELIAMMDADDLALPDRFEKQLKYFEEDNTIDLIGGYISEFVDTIDNIVGVRDVPLSDNKIKKYLKKRCPFNHMTVMFKREAVLKCGNYQDWYYNEDYYLWCRMYLGGCQFRNTSDILCYVRVGKDMYKRRGGLRYFKSEFRLQQFMLNNKIINFFEYIINIFIRFIIQVIMPDNIRSFFFRSIFRKRYKLKMN
jgi:glycosyltransferase involved in cell wall biosynthesis